MQLVVSLCIIYEMKPRERCQTQFLKMLVRFPKWWLEGVNHLGWLRNPANTYYHIIVNNVYIVQINGKQEDLK